MMGTIEGKKIYLTGSPKDKKAILRMKAELEAEGCEVELSPSLK